jgi:uncharacterized caspase-like protein
MRRSIQPEALLRLFAIVSGFIFICATAGAQEPSLRGIALVIGEAEYAGLAPLQNPENDARALDQLLDTLGFDVRRVLNADAEELNDEIAEFAEDAAEADVAFIYYSGHGIEAGGENYLVPIDADVSSPQAAGEKLVPLTQLLDRLKATVPVTILLLDACRTNSFPPGQMVQLPGSTVPVAVSPEGLGETRGELLVANSAPSRSLGVVIGFAAEPGRPALDGEPGGNSPYAAALLKHLGATGYGFADVMTLVSEEVYLRTAARQLPWTNSSLRRFLSFGAASETADPDESAIREGRRALLLTIAAAPPATRTFVEQTAFEEGVPLDALYGMLKALGVDTSGPDLEAQLGQGAERLKAFMAERPADAKSDPELIRLSELADRAQAEGAIDVALKFRERASARADELDASMDVEEARLRENRLELAATYAEHASTAELNFDYLTAAGRYEDAFEQVRSWDRDIAVQYKQWQADALSNGGYYSADSDALRRAVAAYEEALTLAPRESNPEAWGMLQNNLGIALTTLGDRGSDNAMYERALVALGNSLEIWNRNEDRERWSAAQNNVATVLFKLGMRDGDTRRLEQSAATFRLSLEGISREADAFSWGQAQANLASVLTVLAERALDGSAYLEDAIARYRLALEVLTREEHPLQWATVQHGLASALTEAGSAKGDEKMLEDAIVAMELSLEVRPRERSPLEWASTQNNIGTAYVRLGRWQSDRLQFERALSAYRAALEVVTRETSPIDWALVQNGVGNALYGIAQLEDDPAFYREAAEAYRTSLLERTPDLVPVDWAYTRVNLGNALRELGHIEQDAAILAEAVEAYRPALAVITPQNDTVTWANVHYGLGWSLTGIGEYGSDTTALAEAIESLNLALSVYTPELVPYDWTIAQNALSGALQLLGTYNEDPALLEQSIVSMRAAWEMNKHFGIDVEAYFTERIAGVERLIAEIRAHEAASP